MICDVCSTWNTAYIAAAGHLECLKYAHENGCPWNPLTTTNAVRYGNLDCVKYIYRHTIYSTPECENIIKPIINDWINLVNIAKKERSYVPTDIWYLVGKYW
jgi:hypothetical protein